MNQNRHIDGHFASLIGDMVTLEWDHEQFSRYTRFTPAAFKKLLQLVAPQLRKNARKNPGTLSPAHRLILTLHYLAEGCSMQEVARNFRVGKTTAHVIIKEVCRVLWNVLQPLVMKPPNAETFEKISTEFYERWNMPNCIGAVDGKHILMQAPSHSGSEYLNYKKSFSIVLMAACDAHYRLIFIDVGAQGSNHDSAVFRDSDFGKLLLGGNLGIPSPTHLPHTKIEMDYFLVIDQAFPLHRHIMRPYPGQDLEEDKSIFNYRLSCARRTIENTFGILVQRWRVLRKEIIASRETCEEVVMASLVLHNFLQTEEIGLPITGRGYARAELQEHRDKNGVLHLSDNAPCSLRSIDRLGSNNYSYCAKRARDKLKSYFVSEEGSVPWQLDYVRYGRLP